MMHLEIKYVMPPVISSRIGISVGNETASLLIASFCSQCSRVRDREPAEHSTLSDGMLQYHRHYQYHHHQGSRPLFGPAYFFSRSFPWPLKKGRHGSRDTRNGAMQGMAKAVASRTLIWT